jgi:hypothetical protein
VLKAGQIIGVCMKFGNIVPILRSFDEAKAKEFYVDFLGFSIDCDTSKNKLSKMMGKDSIGTESDYTEG